MMVLILLLKMLVLGDFKIQANDTLFIQNSAGTTGAEFWSAGTVQLNYNGVKKFETTSAGATLTGALTVTTDLDVDGTANLIL